MRHITIETNDSRSDMGADLESDHSDGTDCPEWTDCHYPADEHLDVLRGDA